MATKQSGARAAGVTAVIGAGPHGLAATAHLRAAGLDVRTFGEPLEFWQRHMPAAMLLRSRKRSSNISDPRRALTIEDYERTQNRRIHSPNLEPSEFIDYGLWFARQVAPDVDRRKVARLSRGAAGFALQLEAGSRPRDPLARRRPGRGHRATPAEVPRAAAAAD